MKVEKDFEELLKLFNKNKVRYCIVGAYAVAFYAIPRYTKDIDILVDTEIENASRIINSLKEFGFKNLKLTEKDFCEKNIIVQLGYEPVRVDIMTSIDGCNFKEVWNGKRVSMYGKHKAFFIGISELIKNKKISTREQDKIDLKVLSQVKNRYLKK